MCCTLHVHNCQQTVEAHGDRNSFIIAMLPPELMRGIIFFAVGDPDEHHAILQLSQVSRSLRQTVLNMSWLFTEANWDCWPTPLLDLWCQRAGAQLLTVSLSPWTICRLADGEAPELQALLESYSRRWGTLMFETTSDEGCIHFLERLLQCACPLLHTIRGLGDIGYRKTLHLHPDCVPSLQALSLSRIWLAFSTPSTSVTELTCTCTHPTDWSPFLDAVKGCHLIRRLTIKSPGYYEDDPIAFPAATGKAVLLSLTDLEIEELGVCLAPALSRFLGHCDIPKLESLCIRDRLSAPTKGFESLCQNVARR